VTSQRKQTVIITGASSGIGFAVAKAYLQRGDNVVGNARTAERLQEAAGRLDLPGNFLPVAGDIGRPQTAKDLLAKAKARFGNVDILINNAGIFNAKSITQYTTQELDEMLNTNLRGFFYATQEAAAHMSANKRGHIINVTASLALQPNASVPASLPILIKGGINHATRALAIELAPHNVQVNAVAPGIVDTPMYTKDMHAFLVGLQPAGRMGTVEEIAAAVLYLGDAPFTTGVILPVDGGMSAGKW
jgi:NAD(P)-dependent dehydrogenase (short-subunit alcohol dehydrogenase family)